MILNLNVRIADEKVNYMKYDIALYDHNDFCHGEGWEAMADHAHQMTDLERLIFEDCYPVGSSHVCAPAYNAQTLPKRKRLEWLSDLMLRYTKSEISKLIECWDVIGATPEMVDTFITWCNARDVQMSLNYFSALALELENAEDDPADHGYYLFWLASNDDEFHKKILWQDRHDRFYSVEDNFLNEDEEYVEPELEPFEASPPEFRYRKLPDEGNGKPFLTIRQANRLVRILKCFKTRDRLPKLLALGKYLFAEKRILFTDRWVWKEYASAKKRCQNDLPDIAKRLFDRIRTARSIKHLKFLSAYTYAHFNGELFNDEPAIKELQALQPSQKAWVWNYIKKRKREFA